MGSALEPELAAAYVRELSADVRAVAILDADGSLLAGTAALADLAALVEHGAVATDAGVAWVARGTERTLVAVAGPAAQIGPTGLDAAAAIGATTPVEPVANPSAELKTAVQHVIAAT